MTHRDKPGLIAQFNDYYDDLVRFLTWRTGDAEHAADVAQETYFRVAAVQDSGQVVHHARSFILRVARNLSVDLIRRDKWMAQADPEDEQVNAVADPMVPQDEAWAAKERLRLLDQALRDLPPKPREALLLHRVEGLSQAEIARRLGVSESMVVKYVAQALRHCRQWRQRLDEEA